MVKRPRNFRFNLEAPHFFFVIILLHHKIEFSPHNRPFIISECYQSDYCTLIIVGFEFTRASSVGEEFLRIPIALGLATYFEPVRREIIDYCGLLSVTTLHSHLTVG